MHLITVNDYLARRDAEWMGRIHRWLGPRASAWSSPATTTRDEKRAQYGCDITYGTNNEFGFDYLRDNMADVARRQGPARPRLRDRRRGRLDPHRRGPHAADHLAAASPTRPSSTTSSPASSAACKRDDDYEVDEEKRTVVAHRGGHREGRAGARRRQPLRRGAARTSCTSCQAALQGQGAVQARQGLHHPGRRGEDRRRVHRPHPRGPALAEGLHQAVEAKEGVKIKEENQTLATITLQNYFRMYEKLAGMTGTAADRGRRVRRTPTTSQVVPIPTNRPMVRADQRRPHLQDRGRQVRRRRRRHRRALRDAASRCSSARSRSRSPRTCRACSRSGASRTRC